jgi:hypothetical protein
MNFSAGGVQTIGWALCEASYRYKRALEEDHWWPKAWWGACRMASIVLISQMIFLI